MKVKTKLCIIFLILFSNTQLLGQGTISYGLYQTSNPVNNSFVSFDYVSNTFDTLFDFHQSMIAQNFRCGIDPYNARYFFGGTVDSLSGSRMFTINLWNNVVSYSQSFSQFNLDGMEYDIFQNKLIYRNGSQLESLDLITNNVTAIGTIAPTNTVYGNTSRAYNPIAQEYLYISGPSYTLNFIDVVTGATISTSSVFPSFNCMTYSITNNTYYGLQGNNGDIVSINPNTGTSTLFVNIPDWGGIMNRQQAVIDQFNNLLIFPYYSTSSQSKFAKIDLITGTIISTSLYPMFDFAELHEKGKPIINNENGLLTSVYGGSYQWYLNNTLIPGATFQIYQATQSGNYKVVVNFLDSRIDTSDQIVVIITEDNERIELSNTISISPNPTFSQMKIASKLPFTEIKIMDIRGKEFITIMRDVNTVDVSNLTNGIYFIKIMTKEGAITKKFVKQ